MCFDPVSLGLMAAGTALSAGGSIMSAKAQKDAQNKAQAAENAVLNSSLDKQAGFQAQNTQNVNDIVSKFAPGAQSNNLASAEANRDSAIGSAITNPDTNVTSGPYTPQIVKDVAAKKMLDGFQYATNVAKAQAKAGSYGDVVGANSRAISDASGNVDLVNNFSKGQQAILPDQQSLAAAGVYTPPSGTGSIYTSLGNLLAGYGASGKAAGFTMPQITVPGFNPIAGVTGQ